MHLTKFYVKIIQFTLFYHVSPNPLNKKANGNERKKKQTNLNQFLFCKNGNSAAIAKKIIRKNVRDELCNLNNKEKKRLKLAMNEFSKEHRQANRKLMMKSKEKGFIQGVVGGASAANELLSINKNDTVANQHAITRESSNDSSQAVNENTLESNSNDASTQSGVLPEAETVNVLQPTGASQMVGKSCNDLTWHERSCALSLHFHPDACGEGEPPGVKNALNSAAGGASCKSVTEWLSQENKRSLSCASKWCPILGQLEWKSVKK